jgi:hypothetical protein
MPSMPKARTEFTVKRPLLASRAARKEGSDSPDGVKLKRPAGAELRPERQIAENAMQFG